MTLRKILSFPFIVLGGVLLAAGVAVRFGPRNAGILLDAMTSAVRASRYVRRML